MKKLYFIFLSVVIITQVDAQKISGTVRDDQGKSLNGASLVLKMLKDSSVVKISASNATGNYMFDGIKPGKYFVNATFIGYAMKNMSLPDIKSGQDISVPEIILTKSSGSLKEV